MSADLPEAFCERVTGDPFLGKNLLQALESEVPVSVRFNPNKFNPNLDVIASVPWCEAGVYLRSRPIFTIDPLFHAGAYYPQEAGSMLLDHVLRLLEIPEQPLILDLCASPGGKSTLIASFLKGNGLLVSNEIVPQRASILRENMSKWGMPNTIVTNAKPTEFKRLGHFFDVLLVDAPCSGEGMFRKDKASRNEWSEANVLACVDRQRNILSDVWDALRPGGYMVYSTCTFNRFENEDNIRWMMEEFGAEVVRFNIPETLSVDREGWGVYCLPGVADTEGFYLAVLQKTEEKDSNVNFQSRLSVFKERSFILPLIDDKHFKFYQREDWVYAIPGEIEREMLHIQATLRVLKFGVTIGKLMRKGLIPSEELALAIGIRATEVPRINLTRDQALDYLRGDTFSVSGTDGWNLMCYEGESLGWIKKIGNRFNNHYPKEWRIRMRIDR